MLVLCRTSGLKRLAPRAFLTSARRSGDVTPAEPALSATPEPIISDPHAWEREKLRLQLDKDAKVHTEGLEDNERVRLAKVWGWTLCFTLRTAENMHSQHLRSQEEMAKNARRY